MKLLIEHLFHMKLARDLIFYLALIIRQENKNLIGVYKHVYMMRFHMIILKTSLILNTKRVIGL
jgi:hypothetical protein